MSAYDCPWEETALEQAEKHSVCESVIVNSETNLRAYREAQIFKTLLDPRTIVLQRPAISRCQSQTMRYLVRNTEQCPARIPSAVLLNPEIPLAAEAVNRSNELRPKCLVDLDRCVDVLPVDAVQPAQNSVAPFLKTSSLPSHGQRISDCDLLCQTRYGRRLYVASCSKCGRLLLPNYNYCVVCGKLAAGESARACSQCGAGLPSDAKICANCGAPAMLEVVPDPPPAVQSPKPVRVPPPIAEQRAAPTQQYPSGTQRSEIASTQARPSGGGRRVTEKRGTCAACGNTWFFGKLDEMDALGAQLQNTGKALSVCCSGCLPALFIPDAQAKDPYRCPRCGSKAVKIEQVVHNV